jgi:hypothetical protein
VAQLSERGIDVYAPDSNLAQELNGGPAATRVGRMQPSDAHLLAMRQKLRTPEGQRRYGQRKTIVEPVFGVLKEQRGMRRFRLRGIEKVRTEWMLAAVAPLVLGLDDLEKPLLEAGSKGVDPETQHDITSVSDRISKHACCCRGPSTSHPDRQPLCRQHAAGSAW